MIQAKLEGTARTLVLTLRARADEQDQPTPLLDDSWSKEWYEFVPEYDDYDDWYNPAFQLATVIRSRLIDDYVQAFIDSHDNPLVVELGAGFSTRYYRLGQGKTRWIELDLEEAVVVRRKLDVEVKDHWFLAADMTNPVWLAELPDEDPKNILFIAEGVLMFAENVPGMFKALQADYKGATFIFDVVNPAYIERVNDDFTRLESPMHWGITEKELKAMGLNIQESAHLLLEYPERWDAIGIAKDKRSKDRSGYVVSAQL